MLTGTGGLDREMLEMMLGSLREFGRRELPLDMVLALDAGDESPSGLVAQLHDADRLGLHLLFLPERHGGLGGGAYDIYRVSEAMAGIDLSLSTAVLATFLGTDPILVGGTEAQQDRWLGRVAREGLVVAYGATEPGAGSDLGALQTTAVPIRDNGAIESYRIDGQKQWITNGGVASLYTILAKTPEGPSWFVVERGTPGLSWGKPEDKHGLRASNTAAVFLDGVVVPAAHLVGETPGRGLTQAQAVFGYTRLMVAAFGLGAGWAALERAIRYGQVRVQAGSPLFDKQGYTHKLIVPNAVWLEAARAVIEWTAERLDGGEKGLATEGAVAKYVATEAGNRAAEDAIQAHGGCGYTRPYLVEKIKRDVRITTIYEGTSEILENTIARDRWQLHLKTRGGYYPDWAARLGELEREHGQSGVGAAAMALRALGALLERCRLDRLTRQQHVLLRLGEIVARVEAAAVLAERAATGVHPTRTFDAATIDAMARVVAREAVSHVVWDGLRLAIGAGQTDPDLLGSLGVEAAARAQEGLVADMSFISGRLKEAFPPE